MKKYFWFIFLFLISMPVFAVNFDFPPKMYQLSSSLGQVDSISTNGFQTIDATIKEWKVTTLGDPSEVQISYFYGYGVLYKAIITYNNKIDIDSGIKENKTKSRDTWDAINESLNTHGYTSSLSKSFNSDFSLDSHLLAYKKYINNDTVSFVNQLSGKDKNYVLKLIIESKNASSLKEIQSNNSIKNHIKDVKETMF